MSSNQSSTFKSFSTSFSSSTINGQTTSRSEQTYTDPAGTHVRRTSQQPGQAPVEERIDYDNAGRRIENTDGGSKGRIEDVTDTDADKKYDENIEDEYAKREGGA